MSTLKTNTIKNTDDVEMYLAKAWVNFNGTGTVAIRAAGNVSSITDNGTGLYTVNLATAMPDANYSAIAIAKNQYNSVAGETLGLAGLPLTSSVQVRNANTSTMYDVDIVCVAIFR